MNVYNINLTDKPDSKGFQPYMKAYILDKNDEGPRPCVVICPGGAYSFLAENWEGERTAMAYSAAGFNAVVVNYTTYPGGVFPCQLKQVAKAISICRQNSERWQINPEQIAVLGFSAGGHLAASISTLWNSAAVFTADEISKQEHRPNATILCYPVIVSGDKAHTPSIQSLIGCTEESNRELWNFVSLEERVNCDTPPAFIWHTVDDTDVPVENSIYYAEALRKDNIPFELHLYPNGGHGMQLATENIVRSRPKLKRSYNWHAMSVDWLADLFDL